LLKADELRGRANQNVAHKMSSVSNARRCPHSMTHILTGSSSRIQMQSPKSDVQSPKSYVCRRKPQALDIGLGTWDLLLYLQLPVPKPPVGGSDGGSVGGATGGGGGGGWPPKSKPPDGAPGVWPKPAGGGGEDIPPGRFLPNMATPITPPKVVNPTRIKATNKTTRSANAVPAIGKSLKPAF